MLSELQKRADRADQSVLFFLASANFWEKHAKNRQKHVKTGEKQRFFGANFFCGKNWSVLIFTPFATMPLVIISGGGECIGHSVLLPHHNHRMDLTVFPQRSYIQWD